MKHEPEIPAFLLRTQPQGQSTTTTPAPKAPKKKRLDSYIARIYIAIPLDMGNADSLASAIKTVAAIEKTLPAGATFKNDASLGKI